MKTLFLLLLSINSHAAKEVGNGGDAVVCRDSTGAIQKAELLDYYEARTLRALVPKFLDTADYAGSLKLLLERLARQEPQRAAAYAKQAEGFTAEASILPGVELVDIPDSRHVVVPRGCAVEQAVIQNSPRFPRDKRYVVSKEIWDALDGANRAGLVLHELIYREAIDGAKADDSITVRYLTSLIAADAFDIPFAEKREVFAALGFKYFAINGIKVIGITYERWSEDSEAYQENLDLEGPGTLTIAGFDIKINGIATYSRGLAQYKEETLYCRGESPCVARLNGKNMAVKSISFVDGKLRFYQAAELQFVSTRAHRNIPCHPIALVQLHADGSLKSCALGGELDLVSDRYQLSFRLNPGLKTPPTFPDQIQFFADGTFQLLGNHETGGLDFHWLSEREPQVERQVYLLNGNVVLGGRWLNVTDPSYHAAKDGYPDGMLKSARIPTTMQLPVGGRPVEFLPAHMNFHRNGNVEMGLLKAPLATTLFGARVTVWHKLGCGAFKSDVPFVSGFNDAGELRYGILGNEVTVGGITHRANYLLYPSDRGVTDQVASRELKYVCD